MLDLFFDFRVIFLLDNLDDNTDREEGDDEAFTKRRQLKKKQRQTERLQPQEQRPQLHTLPGNENFIRGAIQIINLYGLSRSAIFGWMGPNLQSNLKMHLNY